MASEDSIVTQFGPVTVVKSLRQGLDGTQTPNPLYISGPNLLIIVAGMCMNTVIPAINYCIDTSSVIEYVR